ncbi:tetratricopeptide repeat protein [Fusobacterium sp. oral taxon 203]|uniref:tetratricopeptide repeat protein n=1 Tax=Fusobacterium sp. oral taxon 203 TaxID=671211 RepID=UPI000B926BD3|nr:tetratricopeptide repeat protein [Fusobacterium sp. oral taxon 203]ASS38612.1 GlcNAc transferase [Fusobacterium sp. oral taxon 203]
MKDDLLKKIEDLYDLDKHQEIIDMIETLPAEQLNNELIGQLGRAYNNVQNYEKAIEILKSIELEEGNTMRWNYRIGYSYYYLDDYENAEKCFLKAHEINPEDEEIKSYLLNIYIELSKQVINKDDSQEAQDKALEYALKSKEYITTDDDKIQCDSYLAWFYDKIGACDLAEELLKSVVSSGRDDIWVNSEYGYCLGELNRLEESLEHYLRAKELGRNDGWINVQIARCYKALDKNEVALKAYLKAEKFEKDDIWLLSEIAWLYDGIGKYKEGLKYLKRIEKLGRDDCWFNTEYGFCLMRMQKYDKAIEKYKHALELKEELNEEIYLNCQIGFCYRFLEQYEEALKHHMKSQELGRNDDWINIEIGLCYKELGKYEKALEHYLIAYEQDKEDAWLLSDIGWIYNELEKYEDGLEFLLKSQELGREDSWIYAEIGQCLGRLGKYEEGIEKLKKGLEILDEDKTNENIQERIFINSEIGWLYGKIENLDPNEALHYLYAARDLGRDDQWLNAEIGWELGYNDKGKDEEAIKYFERSIELGRDDEWVWARVANIYFDLERYEDALKAYNRAYELEGAYKEGKDSLYICSIGRTLRRLGKYEEAVEKLLESRRLSLEEGDGVDLEDLELAHCYAVLGDKEKAEEHMKLSLDALGTYAESDEYLKKQFDEIKEMINVLSKPS